MLGKVQVIHIKYKYSKNTTRQKASVINKALRGFFLFVYKAKLRVSAEESKQSVYSTFTDYLRCSLDNNSMKLLKFLSKNKIQLTINNKKLILTKIKYTKNYSIFYTIKNKNYA
jgi:hypothetical protein